MTRVTVGLSTCGIAAGAEETYRALESKLTAADGQAELRRTGCIGMCYQEPLVEVSDGDGERYLYGRISPDKVDRLLEEHLEGGVPIADWLVRASGPSFPLEESSRAVRRLVLNHCADDSTGPATGDSATTRHL